MGWILTVYLLSPNVIFTEYYASEKECVVAMEMAKIDNENNVEKITCSIGMD